MFVIVCVYFSEVGGFVFVYVDVYWFGSIVEVDDFDLDVSFEDCVIVVEWGYGLVDDFVSDCFDVVLSCLWGSDSVEEFDEFCGVVIDGVGECWVEV